VRWTCGHVWTVANDPRRQLLARNGHAGGNLTMSALEGRTDLPFKRGHFRFWTQSRHRCTFAVSATVRHFTTDGLSQASYRATRDGRAIDYVLKRPVVLVGSPWPGASSGSVMQMVVPFPSAETSVILPPSCWVTRLWTMYRPSPILPCARQVVKNGSKT
jgi:hypothetical protein